jgi:Glycosyltransferases involved in cell wall biogenesis
MTKLTIVMPVYNEGERIYRNLIETVTQIEKFSDSFRIIAVNDGSTDESKDEIMRAAATDHRIGVVSYDKNKGKGYAVRRGILASKSQYTAFLDADLEIPPYLLEGMLNKAEETGAEVVIGSKLHKDSKVEYPFMRKVLSYGYYVYMKLLFGLKVKDTQTGIKLFNTEKIRPVLKAMKTSRFSFDIEILAISAKLGYKIEEMPVVVNFSRNKGNRSTIKIRSIAEMIRDSIRIKVHMKKTEREVMNEKSI